MTSSGPWRPPAPTPPGASTPDTSTPDASTTADSAPGGRPARPTPPEEITIAWTLWLAATVLALVGALINSATAKYGDLPAATRDAVEQAVTDAGASGVTVEGAFTAALVLGAVFAVAAAAVTVWLAFRLRAGKGWARTMLNLVAVFLVVDAVSVVVGVFTGVAAGGGRGDVLTFVVFSLQILAGLCAGTAVWRQHTAEATAFLVGTGGRGAAG